MGACDSDPVGLLDPIAGEIRIGHVLGNAGGEAAGRTLIKALLMAKALPEKISIGGSRLQPVLQPLCDELQIQLWPVSSLPALDQAMESLSRQMMMGGPGRL